MIASGSRRAAVPEDVRPVTEAPDDVRYAIDRMVVRGGRIFGWGWISDRCRVIETVSLIIEGDAWRSQLSVNYGLARDDVGRALPGFGDAARSGFVATGYTRPGVIRRFAIEAHYADGGKATLDVTGAVENLARGRRKLREIGWIVRAVARRARRGDFRGILARARAQNYLAPWLQEDGIARTLRSQTAAGERITIMFDHTMGGGANVYRERAIEERVAARHVVLLCTYNLPTLDYRLTLRRKSDDEPVYRISTFVPLDALIAEGRIDEIVLNSPVSFDEPLVFAEWLTAVRESHPSLRLTVALHDYFVVCPSFPLLDADGRYCGIPALAQCESCIARHRASYVALTPRTTIGAWRAIWGRCLDAADEVRCFSESTKSLLLRAYPALDRTRISVVPHRVDYMPARLPRIDARAPLAIGVIGHISEQKGAGIVREIVARLDRERRDGRVVVIGTLDVRIASPRLAVTGTFRRDNLVDLIEAQGINMLLFPSICPETFSYVIEEATRLRLPIVAFDLGAPGERLRRHPDARLCATVSADSAFDTLIAFDRERRSALESASSTAV